MLGYALRRLILASPLLIGITFVSFLVIHLAPGEPVDSQEGVSSTQSDAKLRERLREIYGLDKPLHVQYWNWVTRLARLDFGRSFSPDARPGLQLLDGLEDEPVTVRGGRQLGGASAMIGQQLELMADVIPDGLPVAVDRVGGDLWEAERLDPLGQLGKRGHARRP